MLGMILLDLHEMGILKMGATEKKSPTYCKGKAFLHCVDPKQIRVSKI